MEVIQRFPKWLTEEEFDLHYSPREKHPYEVTLCRRDGVRIVNITGVGDTIGQAAKQAFDLRQESRNPVPAWLQ